ncbi:unnamed protein product [Protopolystoma xenopodis]|uniref:Uncharacterized protein n=1 Tax=Protopolystoma xenopodis TaxID=117903 RepID=A0A3S5BNG6_9PLAT|nr:unnamed protein product [Protopolystoma xenopodis]
MLGNRLLMLHMAWRQLDFSLSAGLPQIERETALDPIESGRSTLDRLKVC